MVVDEKKAARVYFACMGDSVQENKMKKRPQEPRSPGHDFLYNGGSLLDQGANSDGAILGSKKAPLVSKKGICVQQGFLLGAAYRRHHFFWPMDRIVQ